ncbi:uncharacterized protein LOC100207579 isoform X2 [Hydra vulgaris]|uniref:uncharacterized protein LOC100207579 isoform X2 n=1 Tax=Hydra vulgaris TaxID=6087 RepID=UPI0032EA1B95
MSFLYFRGCFFTIFLIMTSKSYLEKCTYFNWKTKQNENITQEWFMPGQFYSYCMYYDVDNGQHSLSLFDMSCSTLSCNECMTACNLNQTFNLTKCLITCKNYNLCELGCLFYSHIKENDTGKFMLNEQNQFDINSMLEIIPMKNISSNVAFQWTNIFSKIAFIKSIYLITITLVNGGNSLEVVIGLTIENILNIREQLVCSNKNGFGNFEIEFRINIYPINFNGYNELLKMSSNFTKCANDSSYDSTCIYLNVTHSQNSSIQPVVLPTGYISNKAEFTLDKGLLLGTLFVLKKVYTVSFKVKPTKYSKCLKSVLHLTLGQDFIYHGDRTPGVWFHEDGSGKLVIFNAVNANANYLVETAPLALDKWSSVKISQIMLGNKYWYSVDLNGVNIHRTENSNARDFQNVKVYASDPWYDAQDGSMTDLLIINGTPEFLVGNTPTPLLKGKLIAEIPKLDKDYLVSLDFFPNKIIQGSHGIIYFSYGSNYGVLGILCCDYGKLLVMTPLYGYFDVFISNYYPFTTTNQIKVFQWLNIEIAQNLIGTNYVYTIKINGETVFTKVNKKAQSFDNVKVYASDFLEFFDTQDGSVKDFFIINGISNSSMQPIVVLPKDFIIYKEEINLTQGSLLGTLNVLKKVYTVSFNVKPLNYSIGIKNVLQLTLANDFGDYGDKNLDVYFHKDGSGKLVIVAAVNSSTNYYIETSRLPLSQWSSIKIYQSLLDNKYWFSVDLNNVNIYKVENLDARDYKNIKVYASDSRHDTQNGSISELLIINGNAEYIIGNILTPLVQGQLITEIPKFDKEYLISFDINPNKFVSGWHNVVSFIIGSENKYKGYKIPCILFHKDGDGKLQVVSPVNGIRDYYYNSKPMSLQIWSNIVISQILKNDVYVYSITINGQVVSTVINNEAETFDKVKVYASDPEFEVQNGSIKNLFIVNGISNSEMQLVLLPTDYIYNREEFIPTPGLFLGTLNVMMKVYTVSFRIKPKKYTKVLNNILHLTLGKNFGSYGDRNPGVWFHEDGSGKLVIFAAVSGNASYYIETPPLSLGQWSTVKIYQSMLGEKYWFSIDLNGVNIHRAENHDARDFNNIKIYASDVWYNAQDCSIIDLLIVNGKADYLVENIPTSLVNGKIIALIPKLDKEYMISIDIYPYKFSFSWQDVMSFVVGTDDINSQNWYKTHFIYFHQDGDGKLHIKIPSKSKPYRVYNTKPIALNLWSNIAILQTLKDSKYTFTIKLNDKVVLVDVNSYFENFGNVSIYASDPTMDNADCLIKNFFVINYSDMQPVVLLPTGYINYKKEFTLTRGSLLGTLNVLMKVYTVFFKINPLNYTKGLKSVLHLTLDNGFESYGDRNPGVWFHEDGSGKLVIFAAVSGNASYYIETPPLSLGQWSSVKIYQSMQDGKYWFSVDLNGVNIHRVENFDAKYFNNIIVYASNPWCNAQNGSIANLLVINGNIENLIDDVPTSFVKGKIVAEIPKLEKEFLVSFDVNPYRFLPDWHNVIHFTTGYNYGHFGDRVPSISFHENGAGILEIVSSINGYYNWKVNTNPIEKNQWSNIEISQILERSLYIYKIRINGVVYYSVTNNQSQSFDNVKVYVSNPWYDAQDGSIKNLFVINGIIYSSLKPIVILPADYINERKEFTLTQGSLLGTLYVLLKVYTVSFNVKPMNFTVGLNSVVHLTLGNDFGAYGDRNPGVWFHKDGSGSLVICVAINGNASYCIKTTPLTLGKWSSVKIYQSMQGGKYWFSVDLNGINIHKVENSDSRDFYNMKVYASDPWYNAQNASISELLIINGKIDNGRYGDRVPCISFHENGYLQIAASINGYNSWYFNIDPIELNQWTNIEVTQVLKDTFYKYTIKINGVVYSVFNNQSQSFDNVKVYASDPWSEAQNGSIKNFFIINGISNTSLLPIVNFSAVLPLAQGAGNSLSSAKGSVNNKLYITVLAISVPVLFIVTIFVIVVLLKVHRKKVKSLQSIWRPEIYKIENCIGFDVLPKDDWEIFPENITLDKKIGEGAFGTVFNAKISAKVLAKTKNCNQILPLFDNKEDSTFYVAVKLLKDGANQSESDDFYEEISLMKGIGYHKNIVNIIGCSTIKKPLCLIVEFMENGDLLQFLRSRRNKFYASKMDGVPSVSFMYTESYQQTLETTIHEDGASESMSYETPLDKNGLITPHDLISFAWQVASGMEYLICNKLVHRDLAARNILVGAEKNVKISDFGLTRKVNDELNYMSSKNRRLPVKWMSVEAIFDQVFTSCSDVWAYGVVLFEIVTLGGTPYPSISNRELLTLLKSGYRMSRPENCSEPMYDIMLQCWNEDPLQRPTFTDLRERFDKIMSQGDSYFNFDIDDKNVYYKAASFNSLPAESNDGELEENIFQKPLNIKSIGEVEKINDEPISLLNERYTNQLNVKSTEEVEKIDDEPNSLLNKRYTISRELCN